MAEDKRQLSNSRLCLGMSDYNHCGTSAYLCSSEPKKRDYNCYGILENACSSPEPKEKRLSVSKVIPSSSSYNNTVTEKGAKFSFPKIPPRILCHGSLGIQ